MEKHPGEILQEYLTNAGMSRKELAVRTGVSEKHIWTIVNGCKDISVSFAAKLGYVFEDAKFWIGKQALYDAEQLKFKEENNISSEELEIQKNLKDITEYCIDRGYLPSANGPQLVIELRKFLGVCDLLTIPNISYYAAYRAQVSNNIKVDPYVLFMWQRLCEKETEDIKTETVNIGLLKSRLIDIKQCMLLRDVNAGLREVRNIFCKCGIAFTVVKNFRGAPVQGFIKSITEDKLILCLTVRHKRADTFWFTLFHEIAHVLNEDYKYRFVDFSSVDDEAEKKANTFARDFLIDPNKYKKFYHQIRIDPFNRDETWNEIENFAAENGVCPFIVLGRLQMDEILDWSDYADKVVTYELA
ncbi:MAG: ImmA/IrrE family metallo-endopeptidase [Clostridia bacterium]|nr:ImmA/IrrE family metallo-endopeptidase [Clostridia bacterium]